MVNAVGPAVGLCLSPAESTGLNVAPLRSYNRVKSAVAARLRELLEILKKGGTESSFLRCEALMKKLAEDRFTLAVVGQFGRGKSSLMNAIIGRDLLPVGSQALTSVITVLKFGPKERLIVKYKDRQFPEILPVSALANYLTEPGNPGNYRKVASATVEVPLPFLKPGLELVDTPGIGSEIEANTAETHAFLLECDAVLFVTSPDVPFSGAERLFLQAIRRYANKMFYVLNKTDLLRSEEEKRDAMESVAGLLCERTGAEQVRLFPISARLSLESKLHPETLLFEHSQLSALEEALAYFLSYEKASVFLGSILDQARRLAAEQLGEANLDQDGPEIFDSARVPRRAEIREHFKNARVARSELLRRLRARLSECANVPLETEFSRLLASQSTLMGRQTRRLLARAGCRLGADVSVRCGKWFVRKMRRKAKAWLDHHSEHLAFSSDQIRRELWASLLNNVRDLPPGADIVDLPLEAAKELTWPAALAVRGSLLAEFSWSPDISVLLSCIPTCASRHLLASAMQRECNRLVEAVRWEIKALLNAAYSSVLEARVSELEAHAAKVEEFILAWLGRARARSPTSIRAAESGNEQHSGAALRELSSKLCALRDSISTIGSQADDGHFEHAVPSPAAIARTFDPRSPAQRQINCTISARLDSGGCPVCDYLEEVVFDFFSRTQYSIYSDEKAQNAFAMAGGLCSLHLWQLHSVSSPLGEAAGLAPLVERISRLLAQVRDPGEAQATVSALLLDSKSCPACACLREAECDFIERLGSSLDELEGLAAYDRSQGACLRHLVALVRTVSRDDTVRSLIAGAARHFQATAEDMHGYAMKLAVACRALTNTDEEHAALRAITHLVGSRTLCMPSPGKGEL